jgi:hypothetical protein
MSPKTTLLIAIASAALAVSGCTKDKSGGDREPTEDKDNAGPKKAPESPKPKAGDGEPEPGPDNYIRVLATHSKPKPSDPVVVNLPAYTIEEASIDPQNLEGAKAVITIDMTQLDSDNGKRNKHLRSEDYLEVTKFGTARVEISDVKKSGDAHTAAVAVTVKGITINWTSTFEIVQATADKVTVKAEQTFKRSDFGIADAEGDSAADELKVELQLTFDKA